MGRIEIAVRALPVLMISLIAIVDVLFWWFAMSPVYPLLSVGNISAVVTVAVGAVLGQWWWLQPIGRWLTSLLIGYNFGLFGSVALLAFVTEPGWVLLGVGGLLPAGVLLLWLVLVSDFDSSVLMLLKQRPEQR